MAPCDRNGTKAQANNNAMINCLRREDGTDNNEGKVHPPHDEQTARSPSAHFFGAPMYRSAPAEATPSFPQAEYSLKLSDSALPARFSYLR
jgi:hypothetical protein